jgi:hypothetical protein
MTWSSLSDELDRWAEAGVVASFWWRDDDAISETRQLDALLDCAGQTPVALAVIPDLAAHSLATRLQRHPTVTVLQHGWRHTNHAKEGSPSEYPAARNPDEVAGEFSEGKRLLGNLFGAQYLPVFAPPWHGFDQSYLPLLREAGLKAISRTRPRTHAAVSGLRVSNIHCVPILWSDPPSFGPDEVYLSKLIDHLEGRRQERYDADEPTGVLTHHLVQDTRSFEFMAKLNATVLEHSAACWLDARDIFQVSGSSAEIQPAPGAPTLADQSNPSTGTVARNHTRHGSKPSAWHTSSRVLKHRHRQGGAKSSPCDVPCRCVCNWPRSSFHTAWAQISRPSFPE